MYVKYFLVCLHPKSILYAFMQNRFRHFNYIAASFVALFLTSCEDFLSSIRNENTQEISTLLYNLNDLDVCINGAYGAFSSNSYFGSLQLSELLGSDCVTSTSNTAILPDFSAYNRDNYFFGYKTNIMDFQAGSFLQWASYVGNNSNIVLKSIDEKLPDLKTKTDSLNADRLQGEALLLRATIEFYNNYFVGKQYHLTTLDSLSTLYRKKPVLGFEDIAEPRKTVAQVYRFIISDLLRAQQLLPEKFDRTIHPLAYQYRCKKDVATAMLVKVYFQMNKFDSALVYLNLLLGNTVGVSTKFPLSLSTAYAKMFQNTDKTNFQTGNNNEVIMALHGNSAFLPTIPSRWQGFQWTAFKNIQNGDLSQAKFRVVFDKTFIDNWLRGDTAKDVRYKQLIYITRNQGKEAPAGQWTSLKMAFPTANMMWLRASEFHLMRAEIYGHKNNANYALQELNLIRTRAGIAEIRATVSKETLLAEIIDERARELNLENVRRWDNLRLASLSDTEYAAYLPEPYKSGNIPLGNRSALMTETALPWNAARLYCVIPNNEYIFNPALNK